MIEIYNDPSIGSFLTRDSVEFIYRGLTPPNKFKYSFVNGDIGSREIIKAQRHSNGDWLILEHLKWSEAHKQYVEID